jgi:hypothetical protein
MPLKSIYLDSKGICFIISIITLTAILKHCDNSLTVVFYIPELTATTYSIVIAIYMATIKK